MIKTAIIRKLKSGKYRLYSRKKDKDGERRNLGTYDSLAAAKKREQEVQYFKHHADDGKTDSKHDKVVNLMSDMAGYLEEAGFIDASQNVYDAMCAVDGSLADDEDYAYDMVASTPDVQNALPGSLPYEMTGEVAGGMQGVFSVPEATRGSYMLEMVSLANHLDQIGSYTEANQLDALIKDALWPFSAEEKETEEAPAKNRYAVQGINSSEEYKEFPDTYFVMADGPEQAIQTFLGEYPKDYLQSKYEMLRVLDPATDRSYMEYDLMGDKSLQYVEKGTSSWEDIKSLSSLANHLDQIGCYAEADQLDSMIRQMSEIIEDLEVSRQNKKQNRVEIEEGDKAGVGELVGANGHMGNSVDQTSGWSGLSDSYFYRGYGNLEGIYGPA